MIKQYFSTFNVFSDQEIEDFIQLFEVRRYHKNDFFVKEGQSCNEIAFIEAGIFRSYYSSADGIDMTYCFRFPNDLMASYSSFITGNSSVETMQALSEADLLVIKKRGH